MSKMLGRASLLAVFLAACGPEAGPAPDARTEKAKGEERIDYENDPNRFNLDFQRGYGDLPAVGESDRKPFPSNWWPMRRGGIAYRWLGASTLSPAEKYDDLITPEEVKDVELTLAQKDWKDEPVNEGAEPETFHIGPAAEWEHKDHGRYGSRDPESWYGHCNGWASYSINEDEPTRPVSVRYDAQTRRVTECTGTNTAGCIRFELGDINALGAELYWSDGARMLGRRCEQDDADFTFDKAGRIDKVECRDGNAASLHLVATNMLGRLNRPFVVDLTADREVWNFPVYKFELTRNEEIDLQQALREMGRPANTITATSTWEWNTSAVGFARVHMKLWIVEDSIPPSTEPAGPMLDRYTTIEDYDYILELDANGRVIGGEWVGRSKTYHPDFMWYSYSNSYYPEYTDDLSDRDNRALRFSIFKQILTLSQNEAPPPEGATRKSAEPNLDIPDNNPTGISHTIEVDEDFVLGRLSARVRISHSYRGDLKVVLSHGDTSAVLHSQAGGSSDNLDLAIDVAEFVGASAAGAWTLTVSDLAASDTGRLESWGLDLFADDSGGGGGGGGGGEDNVHEYDASPNAAIPDNDATGITSSINVAEDFDLSRVRVSVDIAHTYRGDLVVELVKGDQTFRLHDKTGGSQDDLQATFDVNGYTGSSTGEWTLRVHDAAKADLGTLRSWTLELTEPSAGGGNGGGNNVTLEWEMLPNLAIPDDNSGGAVASLPVDDEITIETLRVEVAITHTYIGDLKVTIEKDGVTQVLHANEGGSADNINRTFETRAFGNMSTRGTWVLRVIDSAAADTGTIERFKLIASGNRP